jgi:glycerophosphoryl diester phosphodiesterase
MFDFVKCADPKGQVLFNIESKLDPAYPNLTRSVEDFVQIQLAAFKASGIKLNRITYQSFDWRSLIRMRELNSEVEIAALVDDTTIDNNQTNYPGSSSAALGFAPNISTWLAGVDWESMPGETVGEKIAHAAKSIGATILSPVVKAYSSPVDHPWQAGFRTFLDASMVDTAHSLGVKVIPWTVNELQLCEFIVLDLGVDGIISDYPAQVRRWAKQQGFKVQEQRDEKHVLKCLAKHTA